MSKRIEVVFTKDLENIAQIGEVKQVSAGFWRHYLAPRGLALLSSEKRAKELIKKSEEAKGGEHAQPGRERAEAGEQAQPIQATRVARQERKQEKRQKEATKAATLKAKITKGTRKE